MLCNVQRLCLCSAVYSLLFMSGCQKKDDIAKYNLPPITLPVASVNPMPTDKSDLSLKVLAISFPGIPVRDVTIDQASRVITVKVPAMFTSDNMTPTVQVSDSAQVYELNNLKSPALWCTCRNHNLTIKLLKKGEKHQIVRNQYLIRTVYSTDVITLQPLSKPIEIALKEADIAIPVNNLYISGLPTRASLTNEKTGVQYVIDTQDRIRCAYSLANHITISLYEQKIVPGQYRMALTMPNGQEITIPQPVIARAGRPMVTNISQADAYTGEAGADITIRGVNLYADNTTFRLVSANQPPVPIVVKEQTVTGDQVVFTIPENTKPGYYAIEIFQDGQSTGNNYRLSVIRQRNQATLNMVNLKPMRSFPTAEPLPLDRDKRFPVMFGPLGIDQRKLEIRLKFVSVADSNQVVTVPIYYLIENYPHFLVPPTMPVGRYKLMSQFVDIATRQPISESEPFERLIDIR